MLNKSVRWDPFRQSNYLGECKVSVGTFKGTLIISLIKWGVAASDTLKCKSFNVSCIRWILAIAAVPNSVFRTLPLKFTKPRLRSTRGKIWWKSWSFISNNFSSNSKWRISDIDVDSFLFCSTNSKSCLMVDIISWYVRVSMSTAIRQASFVTVMSVSFRKIILLFIGPQMVLVTPLLLNSRWTL